MGEIRPLQGKRVLITRAKSQVVEFIQKIEEEGGVGISAPLLEIRPKKSNESIIQETLTRLHGFDCIVFTSANGVIYFKEFLDRFGIPYEALQHMIAASVGRKTSKQMEKLNLNVSVIPEEFVAEKLAESIGENLSKSSKILVIRGNLSRPVLITELKKQGFNTEDLIVYETIHNKREAAKLISYLKEDQLDYITFTSSSTVDSFMKVLHKSELMEHLSKVTFICIGPITNKTLKEYGFIGVMPVSYTIDDMVKLMVELEQNREDNQ